MISASHNPFQDNGIKLFGPDGFKLSDASNCIEKLIDEDMTGQLARPHAIGRAKRVDGDLYRYIEFAKRTFPKDMTLSGLRVVVDCANGAGLQGGAGGPVGTGRGRVTIGNEPDGSTSIWIAARPTRSPCRRRCTKCAPISASRSTATPTGC
jgi:phosphoglucosamine mutase